MQHITIKRASGNIMSPEQRLARLLGCDLPDAAREAEEMIVGRETPDSSVDGRDDEAVPLQSPFPAWPSVRPGEQAFAKFYGSVPAQIHWTALPKGIRVQMIRGRYPRLYTRCTATTGRDIWHTMDRADSLPLEGDGSVHGILVGVQSARAWLAGTTRAKFVSVETAPQGTCTTGSLEQTEAQLTSILRAQQRLNGADSLLLNGGTALFRLPPASSEAGITTVRDVVWRLNRHGYLEPTILVDRVAVAGQLVERVTGHNAKYIYDEGIGPLAEVRIRRSADVIPIVDAVLGRADAAMPSGSWTWAPDGLNAISADN